MLVLLPLASCERVPGTTQAGTQPSSDTAGSSRIACARGDAALAPICTIDEARGRDGLILTVRHADGGFRRLLVTKDGRGVVAADGAEAARVTVIDAKQIEVTLGGDRYRLPATVDRKAKRS